MSKNAKRLLHKLNTGVVNKILNFSSVDGPGNRTVIFLQGCNFNCLYCHNPETINFCNNCGTCIDFCKHNALKTENGEIKYQPENCQNCDSCLNSCNFFSSPKPQILSTEDIFKIIAKTRNFISGITISGGECTVQFDFLKSILEEAQNQKISAFIDTNAFLDFEKMCELSDFFDKAMIDLKWFDNETHQKLTGKSNDLVLKNTEFLLSRNKVHEIRTVVFPFIGNNSENIRKTAEFLVQRNENVIFKLIKFRKNGLKNPESYNEPSVKLMTDLQNIAINCGCKNVVIN